MCINGPFGWWDRLGWSLPSQFLLCLVHGHEGSPLLGIFLPDTGQAPPKNRWNALVPRAQNFSAVSLLAPFRVGCGAAPWSWPAICRRRRSSCASPCSTILALRHHLCSHQHDSSWLLLLLSASLSSRVAACSTCLPLLTSTTWN